ncbi:7,8-dihydro-8-oxoguanine triphosphatase [Phytophthora citrophthora]|uniref:Oxidized purine nucleoside triphosphate hydrolase n=1 Tax=Phytophthora citrophthora TaxID=4793 RepID=A0AAD9GPB6_9STRA|nr:7,8-dihydro-8-oxoguanine triphosphatase [Phytophthora citrophthora]
MLPSLPRKLLTLAFIVRDGTASQQVLLGMKKRGFGMGKWNGFGGKVEASDANVAAAAAREIKEEANVDVKVEDLEPRGVLLFSFEQAKEVMEVHVFLTQQFSGEPSESEEMKPQWYDVADIPYKNMWADDHFWLPHVLSGKSVNGHFHFSADEDSILDHELKVSSTPVL